MRTGLLLAGGAASLTLAACQTAPDRPAAAAASPSPEAVSRYGCSDGQALSASFFAGRSRAVIARGSGFSVTLPRREAESGLWYADDDYELRGTGPEVTFGRVGEDAVVCRAVG